MMLIVANLTANAHPCLRNAHIESSTRCPHIRRVFKRVNSSCIVAISPVTGLVSAALTFGLATIAVAIAVLVTRFFGFLL